MTSLITVNQFQHQYGVSRSTVYRLNERGLLPLLKVGRGIRIRQSDADRWFASLPDKTSAQHAVA